jgi:hypothetical protein
MTKLSTSKFIMLLEFETIRHKSCKGDNTQDRPHRVSGCSNPNHQDCATRDAWKNSPASTPAPVIATGPRMVLAWIIGYQTHPWSSARIHGMWARLRRLSVEPRPYKPIRLYRPTCCWWTGAGCHHNGAGGRGTISDILEPDGNNESEAMATVTGNR